MTYGDCEVLKGSDSGFATSVIDELLDGSKGYANGPERALLSALLFDGVQAYIHYALASAPKEKARYTEAFQQRVRGSRTKPRVSSFRVGERLHQPP